MFCFNKFSGNILKGSARSTSDNFNIGEYIHKCCANLNILIGGGGHNLAAGVSLKKKELT